MEMYEDSDGLWSITMGSDSTVHGGNIAPTITAIGDIIPLVAPLEPLFPKSPQNRF